MKIFAVALLVGLVAMTGVASAAESCSKSVGDFCNPDSVNNGRTAVLDCTAKVTSFDHSNNTLTKFANLQFEVSYKYMLLAAQFNSFAKDRPGFHAHFKALSDRSWEAGINLIKYVTKRGGDFKFAEQDTLVNGLVEMNEIAAMATVLDTEKALFHQARVTHAAASHAAHSHHYDPEVAHYMEEEYLEDLAGSIRKFSGYANDLKNLYAGKKDINLENYMFDQYLQKA